MPPDRRTDPDFAELLLGSFHRLAGRPLVADDAASADWLYSQAPFCLLAHDTQADPCFVYANLTAQRCFGYDWSELVGLPSRISAEAPDQAERQRALDAVARDGCVANYRGIRVAKSGRRFLVEDATVWTLLDAAGVKHGTAAVFGAPPSGS